MAKGAWRDALADPRAANGELECTLDGGVMDGMERILGAGEEQAGGAGPTHGLTPPLAEQFQRDGREWGIAVFVSLA